MNDMMLIFSSLRSRLLGSVLSILLTAFGVALALMVLLFTSHVQNRLSHDAKGIDLVIGAKGSPLQIILSSVYHIDIPTGNIDWDEAQKWMHHPQVKNAIPLALGDNWHGYRIVGTTPAYMAHYGATLSKGGIWDHAFEAVVGADVPLAMGDVFNGAHGLAPGGHVHDDERYSVVGKMEKTGTVLDRLILTSLDSVLEIHGLEAVEHEGHDHGHEGEHNNHDHHDHDESGEPEITALLIETKSPVATRNLPYVINKESALQAANPALEMVRLTSMLGVGTKTLSLISTILVVIACFSIFAGISGALENRKADLAVLRVLGYSRWRVFTIVAGEGVALAVAGCILGGMLSYIGFTIMQGRMNALETSGASYHLTGQMLSVYGGAMLAGLLAAVIPAYRAMTIDVVRQLD